MSVWILGAIALGGGGWLLFPGAYKLGNWFADYMHWGIHTLKEGPGRWILGIGLLSVPVIFCYLANLLGKWIISLRN